MLSSHIMALGALVALCVFVLLKIESQSVKKVRVKNKQQK